MCLDRLEKFPVRKNKDGWVVAWKVFIVPAWKKKTSGFLDFACRTGGVYAGEKVHVATSGKVGAPGWRYRAGFHTYKTEYAAQKIASRFVVYIVRRVLLKDITATGYQDGLRVIVARKMIVPKEGK